MIYNTGQKMKMCVINFSQRRKVIKNFPAPPLPTPYTPPPTPNTTKAFAVSADEILHEDDGISQRRVEVDPFLNPYFSFVVTFPFTFSLVSLTQ